MAKILKNLTGLISLIRPIRLIGFGQKTKVFISFLIFIGLVFGTYFAYTRAYTPGDTSGVKKVMPPPYSDPSLVGYWTMDDNAASTTVVDSSGNGNNGTAQANTNTKSTTDAIHNRALTFNGTSDYVSVADNVSLRPQTAITISAWIKSTNISSEQLIFSGNPNYHLEIYQSKLTFQIVTYPQGNTVLSSNVWYHIAVTYDEANVRFYVNGVSDGAPAMTTQLGNAVVTNYIGSWPGNTLRFSGSIDDVRIYNRALTASDVAALYQAGSHRTTSESGFSKMLFPPIDQSVVGWWKLNDAAGQTVVKDWTANANTGTSANNIISATGYTGVANTAMTFNGTSDYVEKTGFAFISPPFSLSAWIKVGNIVTDGYYTIISRGGVFDNNTNFDFVVRPSTPNDFRLALYWRNGSTLGGMEMVSAILDNNSWVFVTGVVNASNDLELFVNGSSIGTDTGNVVPTDGSQALRIGKWSGTQSNSRHFNGSISDVRIYNRALNANEVKQLYMRGRP